MPDAVQAYSPQAIALGRFGLGARGDGAPVGDPKRWLLQQLARFEPRPAAIAALPDAAAQGQALLAELREARMAKAAGSDDDPQAQAIKQQARRDLREGVLAAIDARLQVAVASDTPFVERLVHFWSNRFAISLDKQAAAIFAPGYEFDAIRPHVLGRFEDMAAAVLHHPAMLSYLDQPRSMGPNSALARRAAGRGDGKPRGLNENLAREVMELHTLGVRAGYSQADVTEFARALTGWSIVGPDGRGLAGAEAVPGSFVFRPALHEPGARSVFGRSYAAGGEEQARAILADLCAAPATATHLATALARHFAGDDPPPALVARLAQSYTASRGDLPSVYATLIASPESWNAAPLKFKTPWEWLVSAMRALALDRLPRLRAAQAMTQLGQPVWKPGSPAGWDDIAASWAAPDALMRRVELAQRLAAGLGERLDPRQLAETILPDSLSANSATTVARAESAGSGTALLLLTPEFLRR